MKHLFVCTVLMGFVAVSLTALAQDDEAAAPATDEAIAAEQPEKASLTEITVTGKISKEETKVEGKTEPKVKYVLTTAEGVKIDLPKTKAEVTDLGKLVGKDVTVVGKGKEKKEGDKKVVKLNSIVSVKEKEVATPAK